MKVVITGGAGFLGFLLAKRLLELWKITGANGDKQPIDSLTLLDVNVPSDTIKKEGTIIEVVSGDISDEKIVKKLIDRDDISAFHLPSVVSGSAEKDFDLGMK